MTKRDNDIVQQVIRVGDNVKIRNPTKNLADNGTVIKLGKIFVSIKVKHCNNSNTKVIRRIPANLEVLP